MNDTANPTLPESKIEDAEWREDQETPPAAQPAQEPAAPVAVVQPKPAAQVPATREDSAPYLEHISNNELAVIRAAVCPKAKAHELQYFAMVCLSRGVDPRSGMLYLVIRESQRHGRQITIQSSIDYFRSVAEKTGEFEGMDGPFYCDAEGQWTEVWLRAEAPHAAKVTVHRRGYRPRTVVRLWREYMASNPGPVAAGNQTHMLAKSAESIALRQQFPQQLAGIYTEDELPEPEPLTPEMRAVYLELIRQSGASEARMQMAHATAANMTADAWDTHMPAAVDDLGDAKGWSEAQRTQAVERLRSATQSGGATDEDVRELVGAAA
jgi:RecT family